MPEVNIVDTTVEILDGVGSYCLRSMKQTNGYQRKQNWLKQELEVGLRYVQILEGKKQKGFIEYTESENASRAIYADGYIVIHCLWVSDNQAGYGSQLIQTCISEAKEKQQKGVVVVTNNQTGWAPSKEVFIKNGFVKVDEALDEFELFVYKCTETDNNPYFPTNWKERTNIYQDLTILRSFQCPYVEVATENVRIAAEQIGIPLTVIDLKTSEDIKELAPTPYGIYHVLFKGKLISFHRLTARTAYKKIKALLEE
ncbi:GCN5 family acetyltransferase [Alkalihalobacillus pseudalcaliphilus]|uniref:GCN5 family acetyltransferase n=1 Tax=Alkalihalobacillus pseudalcaliphilus TaxID=79884 RepID=UPI00064D9E33|nr:GCN5 family acetyltransferase [Alkalihalobacillus pseudalcaliphilus]KMK75850.1 GCN5 family acetyltransferase [Alkalihalobacillus pseudalcaliphilus]